MRPLIFACAASFIAVCATSVSALPTLKSGAVLPSMQTVADRNDERDHDRIHREKHDQDHVTQHEDDDRYELYKGWHRHHHLPHDWRVRNCVEAGRFWFCP